MKIGVCIPTKGDRIHFLERAKLMLSRQAIAPDLVKIVDDETGIEGIDIALRYELGFKYLFQNGCGAVICWEDDDWYSDNYIETMVTEWGNNGKPSLFGISSTIYYNIVAKKYSIFSHPGRASMMSMIVGPEVLNHKFNYSNAYLDFDLWTVNKKLTRKTFSPKETIAVGIKHGYGLVGGAGHKTDWIKFTHSDMNHEALTKFTKQDSVFYKIMAVKDDYEVTVNKPHDKPSLSVITRRHGDRRPEGFKRNQGAMNKLSGTWEQIFIKDKTGKGLHYANMSFMLASPFISGEYVYMIDDDDFINNPNMIPILKDISEKHNPDVIVFRMTIKNGAFNNHYPSPKCWREKKPLQAHIGGSCFVVKRDLWKQNIHHFGKPRFGDYFFLEALWRITPRIKSYWCDVLMAETGGKPSHGKTEI